jgi:hypothetical protein
MVVTYVVTAYKTRSVSTITKKLNAFITYLELGAYVEPRGAPLRFVMSIAVPLSACIGAAPTGRISVKFDTGGLLWKSVEKLKIWLELVKNIEHFTRNPK